MAPKQLSRKSKLPTTVGPMPYHLRALLGRTRKGRRSSRKTVMKKATICHEKKGAWDDVKCPVCLETPQKAILLLCSEGDCLPYVCDTDYILSACFNQTCDKQSVQRPPKRGPDGKRLTSFHFPADRRRPSCPLCNRGEVTGWIVDEPGREAMDTVVRTCKIDSCGIRGNYADFKDHARLLHDRSNYDVWWEKDSDHWVDDRDLLGL